MSSSNTNSKQDLGEKCINGYLRNNYADYNQIPQDILRLLALFYIIPLDSWDKELSAQMIIDDEIGLIKADESQEGIFNWYNAYGTDIVKNGMSNTWKFQVDTIRQGNNDKSLWVVIGIIERNKISVRQNFIENGRGFAAYYGEIKQNGWAAVKKYGCKCYPASVIQMNLDLTNENGTLSYVINGEDFGIAFDGIDNDKEYCMAVSIFQPQYIKDDPISVEIVSI